MYFNDFDDYSHTTTFKTIKVYKNGDANTSFDLKVNSEFKAKDLAELIETNLKLKPVQKLRLFTAEGLEVSVEELAYIKNGEAVFASRGENFDRSSTLGEYEILKTLGEGGFGEVLLATHKRSGDQVAIKFLKASSRVMASEIDRLFAEAETLKNLHHKGIVRVLNCFSQSNTQIAFVMEYLSGGELLEYVLKRNKLSEDEAREFFRQIVEAVSYCHRSKLIHCDLKLENILLENPESKVVKVVDFGISGLCTGLRSDADGGSLDYMAPEYFNGSSKGVHPGVDVWALGCMLYGMVCGKLPFADDNDNKIIDRIKHARFDYDDAGKKLSREVRHLISRILEIDTEQRFTIHDILDHPWMNGEKMPAEVVEEEAKQETEKKISITVTAPAKRNSTLTKSGQSNSFNVKSNASPGINKRNSNLGVDKSPKVIASSPTASSTRKTELSKLSKKF